MGRELMAAWVVVAHPSAVISGLRVVLRKQAVLLGALEIVIGAKWVAEMFELASISVDCSSGGDGASLCCGDGRHGGSRGYDGRGGISVG